MIAARIPWRSPWARLMPLEADSPRRQPGTLAGLLVLRDREALLAPLPEEQREVLGAELPR